MTKISQAGLTLVKTFEGLQLTPYRDIKGVLTIGYGHTGNDFTEKTEWCQAQADFILTKDVARFEAAVTDLASVPLSQAQFDALVSFTYNVGIQALANSTLRKRLNQRDYAGAADQLLRWDKVTKMTGEAVAVAGLTRRRTAERDLFLGGTK